MVRRLGDQPWPPGPAPARSPSRPAAPPRRPLPRRRLRVLLHRRPAVAGGGCSRWAWGSWRPPRCCARPGTPARRAEYFATVREKLCDMDFAKSGLGYCDVAVGTGVLPKRFDLINYCSLLRWISVHRRWISYALTCCFRRHRQPSAAVKASGLIARLDLDDPFSVRRAELIHGIALIQFAEPIFCEES